VPPLLKTLSARATIPIKSLVLLSKSEWFYGLGAGLLMTIHMLSTKCQTNSGKKLCPDAGRIDTAYILSAIILHVGLSC